MEFYDDYMESYDRLKSLIELESELIEIEENIRLIRASVTDTKRKLVKDCYNNELNLEFKDEDEVKYTLEDLNKLLTAIFDEEE